MADVILQMVACPMNECLGAWQLQGSASAESEIEFVEPQFDAEFACLSNSAIDLLETVKPTAGLVLKITDAMEFTQDVTGNPKVTWYDVEGVLQRSVTPFDGKCFTPRPDGRLYLISDDRAKWATPKDEAKLPYFRHDDSDTVICDFVELHGPDLLRTMNVLTDGHYLSRNLMRFTK